MCKMMNELKSILKNRVHANTIHSILVKYGVQYKYIETRFSEQDWDKLNSFIFQIDNHYALYIRDPTSNMWFPVEDYEKTYGKRLSTIASILVSKVSPQRHKNNGRIPMWCIRKNVDSIEPSTRLNFRLYR